jgi:hypothetical protein
MRLFSILLAVVNVIVFGAALIYFFTPRSKSTVDELLLILNSEQPRSDGVAPQEFLRSIPGVGYSVSMRSIHSSPESIQYIEQEVLPSTFYRFDSYEAALTKSGRLLYVAVVDPVDSDSGLERLRAVPVIAVMSLCNFACIVYYLKKKQRMAVVIADAA